MMTPLFSSSVRLSAGLVAIAFLTAAPASAQDAPPTAPTPPASDASAASADTLEWTTNLMVGVAKARQQDKDVLIDFTGSDWCVWCHRLDNEVFTQQPFAADAPQHFVLVKLDFPRQKPQPAEVRRANARWRDHYQVEGFPTIILADAQGRPYAQTGYQAGGAEAYVEHLTQLRAVRQQRDTHLAAAEKLEGLPRARKLDEAMSVLAPKLITIGYANIVDEIIALDPNNEAGLRGKYSIIREMPRIERAMSQGQHQQVIQLVDQLIAEHNPPAELAGQLRIGKAEAMLNAGQLEQALAALNALGADESLPVTVRRQAYFFAARVLMSENRRDESKAALQASIDVSPDDEDAKSLRQIMQNVFGQDQADEAEQPGTTEADG